MELSINVTVFGLMEITGVKISPVNIKDRQGINIRTGDTVRVWQKVEEKGKTRLQPFEGVVLARKHGNEAGGSFTVRRVNDQYGVEKIFPLYSPMIDRIEIIKRAKVRRAKLYHIREKAAKEIKRQMRNLHFVDISTTSDIQEKVKADEQEGDVSHLESSGREEAYERIEVAENSTTDSEEEKATEDNSEVEEESKKE